ncbi:MAG TPA: tRNA (N6-isopentenyl adenosine(37)-C2)-methylthiotransferase MiaB, partial [Nitrospiria bacterium]|nr:tRNA (N6-isopentenyl adenosine(37)-C2)-methylthiotransferase MiaB [Nitrospiria bacterium]
MTPKRLYIKTFGCQMNVHDSERIAGLLNNEGYRLTDTPEDADMIVVNTCSIREKAEQKAFSDLGRFAKLKRKRPEIIIASAGCVSQQEGEKMLKRQPGVDVVFGSSNIPSVGALVRSFSREPVSVVMVDEPPGPPKSTPAIRKEDVRAWVSIMEGCDRGCTFCVVPTTRGRERSRPSGEILREVQGLARDGYKEITLLGQTVNSYGHTAGDGVEFSDLLAMLDRVEGIERIRFMSPHPCDMTPNLIDAMGDLHTVCEFLHLPVQSGSNAVLERMKRGYSLEAYLEIIRTVREKIPGIALSTDIIVGFPGETEEDFDRTLRLVETVGFDNVYYFNYSPRPNTAAREMDGEVPGDVQEARFRKLRKMEQE